ncbi:hypothetical protein BSZ39_08730 [Bowdeniella nasicola]|uniref:Uncharacterized protein n=1 Tax=Bowdeniella nasicola TaxID=208480 RepID=A0A1Q5Q1B2_9ACTO|nr:hypothetical protein [Bowdeniella nasicola]OKL53597.1 hypothetical protein BSZ39_08730 [Bowdeniella nasicola]
MRTHAEYTSAVYGRIGGDNAYWAATDGQVWSTNLNDGVSRLIVDSEPDSEVSPKNAREVSFQRDHVAVLSKYYRDDDWGAIIRWYSLADGKQLKEIAIKSLGEIERKYDISMSGFATNPHLFDSR